MSAEIWVDVKNNPITVQARPVQPTVHHHLFPAILFDEIETVEGIIHKGANM